MNKNIGHMEWRIAINDPLPQIGDILSAESIYNGQTYKVKVVKIKRIEWSTRCLETHLVTHLMVRSVDV